MLSDVTLNLAYLAAIVLFVFGLKGMTRPRTAVRGNQLAAAGMMLAVVVTLFSAEVLTWWAILIGIVIGVAVGVLVAQRVAMTEMPELVALFNGLGGLASLLVAGAMMYVPNPEVQAFIASYVDTGRSEMLQNEMIVQQIATLEQQTGSTAFSRLATVLSGLIGAVTLSGSLVAFAKLRGYDWLKDLPAIPGGTWANLGLLVFALLLGGCLIAAGLDESWTYWAMAVVALALGYGLVIAIGGADMPVVIALLNSYSGLAAAATGFVLENSVLIVSGSLVGASGLILTQIMCKAMNRSLPNVLFGTLGPTGSTLSDEEVYATVKSTSAEEVAMLLEDAERVVVVPGYGMAVAQAQHAVRDLMNELTARGVDVEFGIHPVAGRMPGHMNVLLAEADIPYEQLLEMDEINNTIQQADVCLVVGANDTVNPDGRTNPDSAIAGMPIIDADKARTCIVIKRSLSPGFAGIPNPLFAAGNTRMLFGDGKEALVEIKNSLEEV